MRATEAQKEQAAIVLIGSTAGKFGEAGHADYAACKSGACGSSSVGCGIVFADIDCIVGV